MAIYKTRRGRNSIRDRTQSSLDLVRAVSARFLRPVRLDHVPIYLVVLAALSLGTPKALGQSRALDCSRDLLPPDEHPQFFPVGTFGPGPGGANTASLYSCHFRAVRELPLMQYVNQDQPQAYRLTVWPAYRLPLIVRLVLKSDGSGELATKAEKSKWEPGRLSVDRVARVSKPEADKFLLLLGQANFWSIPTDEFYIENQRLAARADRKHRRVRVQVLDGVKWDLEGTQGANYHLVSRTFPEPGPNASPDTSTYAELTSYLFRGLGKLEVPPIEATPPQH